MKAIITSVDFTKEYSDKFGVKYKFKIGYDGKFAQYGSQKRDQNKFVKGQETEFTEEEREYQGAKYLIVKPIYANAGGSSNFGRQVKREQSKYSGLP